MDYIYNQYLRNKTGINNFWNLLYIHIYIYTHTSTNYIKFHELYKFHISMYSFSVNLGLSAFDFGLTKN